MSKKIIDLGLHPLADSFLKKGQIKHERKKKLQCFLDKKFKKIFLKSTFSANYRYNNVNYSYTSSNSNLSKKHWDLFYKSISYKYKISNKKVLEIGSNDGYLLNKFKKKNKVVGIDSSKEMVRICRTKKITSENATFSKKYSNKIKFKYGQFELIIANHVLNHSDNEISFLKGCKKLMNNDSILVVEVPYWGYQVKNFVFDQIYHEHRTYFTINYFNNLQKIIGLKIINIEMNNYHGKSLRVFMTKKNSKYNLFKFLSIFIKNENKLKLFNLKTYTNYSKKISNFKEKYINKINKIKKDSIIIAIGASAKGNTFLNYIGLNSKLIYAVTDNSPFKIGKYTPGTHIKILKDEVFSKYKNVYGIILSWNFSKMLKKKIIKYNKDVKFI